MTLDWQSIETVFLDMDGTLLDLHFDNHFWTQFVPARFGEKQGITKEQAFDQIFPHMLSIRGSLEWYDVNYWSQYLQMDVLEMKYAAAERIKARPGAIGFLEALGRADKKIVLATNAHEDTLDIKFSRSGIGPYFDYIATSHQIGVAKEKPLFWQRLQEIVYFDPRRSVFIDDNTDVLNAAGSFGIQFLLTIDQPDLQQEPQAKSCYTAVSDFSTLAGEIK